MTQRHRLPGKKYFMRANWAIISNSGEAKRSQLINLTLVDTQVDMAEVEIHALPNSFADINASSIELLQKQIDKYELLSKPGSRSVLFRHWQGSIWMWLCITFFLISIHLLLWVGGSLTSSLYLAIITLPIGVFSILMAWNRSLQFEVSATGVSLSNRFF